MRIIINIILTALAVAVADYVIPGVSLDNFWTAVVTVVVMGVINALIKPIVVILTLPINILTLGLFSLVINAALILLAAAIVPGFDVSGFWAAMLFSVIVSLLKMALSGFGGGQAGRT